MTAWARLGALTVLLVVGTIAVACGQDSASNDEGVGMSSGTNLDEAECGAAFVDTVTIAEENGEVVAVVGGHYPSACDGMGQVTQEVEGDVIVITFCSTRPQDVACASVLTPFEETLPIDTEGLEPGTYTVQVNDASMNSAREPAILTLE